MTQSRFNAIYSIKFSGHKFNIMESWLLESVIAPSSSQPYYYILGYNKFLFRYYILCLLCNKLSVHSLIGKLNIDIFSSLILSSSQLPMKICPFMKAKQWKLLIINKGDYLTKIKNKNLFPTCFTITNNKRNVDFKHLL